MHGDMPARMVAWAQACRPPAAPLCGLTDAAEPAAIEAAWDAWTRAAVLEQHRHHGLTLDEAMLDGEVYRVRRHFQLWGLPWSERSLPSVGDGHAWVRASL